LAKRRWPRMNGSMSQSPLGQGLGGRLAKKIVFESLPVDPD
jgi:hypothetical protein